MSKPSSVGEIAGTSPTSPDEVLEVESADATLQATKSIGGQYGYVTNLLQQLNAILVTNDYSQAANVLDLQTRIKAGHVRYSRALQDFCRVLGEGSERERDYKSQLQAREN